MMMSSGGKGLASSRNSLMNSSTKDLRFADGRRSTMMVSKDEDKIKPASTKTTAGLKRPASNIGFK